MTAVRVKVKNWSFWSPEAADPESWQQHWDAAGAERRDGAPDASAIPPMLRRRTSKLSKLALTTALDAASGEAVDYSIFCSQHGEIGRTRQILSSMVMGEEISPTSFAQSVHNTSSGLFTIIEKSHAASTSIASGANTFAYGWLEAQAYLSANPTHTVLLVDFDEVIPDEYQRYTDEVQCDHALALVLAAADDDGISIERAPAGEPSRLPQGPQFMAWLQSGQDTLDLTSESQGWQWRR